jgi:uncharacterized membrane protein YidH (DUF202 family)
MPDRDRGGADHGDQPERTRLAWRRTTLATTAVMLLAVSRVALGDPQPRALTGAALTGAALIALGWLGVLGVAHRRIRSLAARSAPPRPAGAAPATLALLAATLAILSALLVP